MNTQPPLSNFDVTGAHPLREGRRARTPVQSRAWAAAITLIAHIVAITAIVEGLRQTNVFVSPPSVTVHIEPERKPEEIQPLLPPLVRPQVITAPEPLVTIAPPPPGAVAASPPVTAAPAISAPETAAPPSHAALNWQGLLLARLEQAKHYPMAAQERRQQGVVLLHFTMDRDGQVLTADIRKSSGYDLLDQEALALIRRAQPLPKPPPDVIGDPIALAVPVEFFLKSGR
jgi:protein TonB